MEWTAAAKSHQGEIARVFAALDGYCPDGACHIHVGDLPDSVCRILDAEPKGACDMLFNGPAGKLRINGERTARQKMRVQKTKRHIGVCHSRLLGAPAVAGRARIATGALRPDKEQTPGINSCD